MSVKFTKTGQGSEANDESLLFEFLDHELPEKIELDYENDLITTKYVGSLQSSQHNGVFLQPIDFEGEFHGDMVDKEGNLITAKERFDQLARLQGRIMKFWVEGIKQIVIIKKLKMTIENYASINYNLSLQPHDLQVAIAPTKVEVFKQKSFILADTDVKANGSLQKGMQPPDINNNPLGSFPDKPDYGGLNIAPPAFQENHKDKITTFADQYNNGVNKLNVEINRIDMKIQINEIHSFGVNGNYKYLSSKKSKALARANEGLIKIIKDNIKLNQVEDNANNLANKSVKRFGVER